MELIDPQLPRTAVDVFDSDRPQVVFFVGNIGRGRPRFSDWWPLDSWNGRQRSESVVGCGGRVDLLAQAKANPLGSDLRYVNLALEQRSQVDRRPSFIDVELPLNVGIAPSHLQVPHVHERGPE